MAKVQKQTILDAARPSITNTTSILHKRKIIVYLIVLIPALLIAGFFVAVLFGVNNDRSGMEDYLRSKYDKEFTVVDVKTRASSIGHPGQRFGTAFPKDDTALIFEVGKSRTTGVYFDGYDSAVWAREERPKVSAFLSTVYGSTNVPDFEVTALIPTDAAPDPIRGVIPNIDDAITRYGDHFRYVIFIKASTDHELSQSDIDGHTEQLRKIIKFVLSKNVSSSMVRYAVDIRGRDESYLCNLSQNQLNDEDEIGNCITKTQGKAW